MVACVHNINVGLQIEISELMQHYVRTLVADQLCSLACSYATHKMTNFPNICIQISNMSKTPAITALRQCTHHSLVEYCVQNAYMAVMSAKGI